MLFFPSTMAGTFNLSSVQVFPCPNCKETINTSMQQCQFCGTSIDHAAAEQSAAATSRVSAAGCPVHTRSLRMSGEEVPKVAASHLANPPPYLSPAYCSSVSHRSHRPTHKTSHTRTPAVPPGPGTRSHAPPSRQPCRSPQGERPQLPPPTRPSKGHGVSPAIKTRVVDASTLPQAGAKPRRSD